MNEHTVHIKYHNWIFQRKRGLDTSPAMHCPITRPFIKIKTDVIFQGILRCTYSYLRKIIVRREVVIAAYHLQRTFLFYLNRSNDSPGSSYRDSVFGVQPLNSQPIYINRWKCLISTNQIFFRLNEIDKESKSRLNRINALLFIMACNILGSKRKQFQDSEI